MSVEALYNQKPYLIYSKKNEHTKTITSFLNLNNNQIVTASFCSLHIISINLNTKQYKTQIIKDNAHSDWITSLTDISQSKIASSSWDKTIKIWIISSNELLHYQTLSTHKGSITKVITLNKEILASCSGDWTVKLWQKTVSYNEIITLNEIAGINSIIKLKHSLTPTLVCSCSEYLSFWNLNTYQQLTIIQGVFTYSTNGLIELTNKNIAVSSYKEFPCVILIDVDRFIVVKEIVHEYIDDCSALCEFNESLFIYACKGNIIWISNEDGEIILNYNMGDLKYEKRGLICFNKGQYVIIDNEEQGFNIYGFK